VAAIEAAGATPATTMREMQGLDPLAFGRLIEAMVALGKPVSQELRQLAGLRPVDEVLGDV